MLAGRSVDPRHRVTVDHLQLVNLRRVPLRQLPSFRVDLVGQLGDRADRDVPGVTGEQDDDLRDRDPLRAEH